MLVTKEFTFDSAHNIPDYEGKCERLHGHTYRLRVTVEAPVDPDSGIAVDFCEVSDLVKSEVIEVLDHTYLNETVPVSTAENVAVWIWRRIGDHLGSSSQPTSRLEVPHVARSDFQFGQRGVTQ